VKNLIDGVNRTATTLEPCAGVVVMSSSLGKPDIAMSAYAEYGNVISLKKRATIYVHRICNATMINVKTL
jgi:hypothetical protein